MGITDEKDGALATAAVAAAAGVAAYGLRKALSSGGSNGGSSQRSARNRDEDEDYEYDDDDDNEDEGDGGSSRAGALLSKVRHPKSGSGGSGSLLQAVWDSASPSLMPLAEEAADAAGKWTAKHAPDIVRDELVPRFIEAFNDAS